MDSQHLTTKRPREDCDGPARAGRDAASGEARLALDARDEVVQGEGRQGHYLHRASSPESQGNPGDGLVVVRLKDADEIVHPQHRELVEDLGAHILDLPFTSRMRSGRSLTVLRPSSVRVLSNTYSGIALLLGPGQTVPGSAVPSRQRAAGASKSARWQLVYQLPIP